MIFKVIKKDSGTKGHISIPGREMESLGPAWAIQWYPGKKQKKKRNEKENHNWEEEEKEDMKTNAVNLYVIFQYPTIIHLLHKYKHLTYINKNIIWIMSFSHGM